MLLGGGGVANDVVDDRVDKGLEGTSAGVDVWPMVIVDGLDKVVKRAVMDQLW